MIDLDTKIKEAAAVMAEAASKGAFVGFSGGRDSLALIELGRPHWEKLTFYWVDSGDAPRETVDRVSQYQSAGARIIVVNGNVENVHKVGGIPADVLPSDCTYPGMIARPGAIQAQTRYDCCGQVLWAPSMSLLQANNVKTLVRGDRKEDKYRLRSSRAVAEPITVLTPLLNWTSKDVDDFLSRLGVPLPSWYDYGNSSVDCVGCTAWLFERNHGAWLRRTHPDRFGEWRRNIIHLQQVTQREASPLFCAET